MSKVQNYIENVIGLKSFCRFHKWTTSSSIEYWLTVVLETNNIYGHKKGYRIEFVEWVSDSFGKRTKVDGLSSKDALLALEKNQQLN